MNCINTQLRCAALVIAAVSLVTGQVRADVAPIAGVLRVPNGGTHPQALSDSPGRIHLIYFKGEARHGDVFYVRSDDGGTIFTHPIRVNSTPESALITGTVRGPHLALGRDDRPHVAWMGSDRAEPKALGKHAPMLYTRLNDARDGFEPQRNVIQTHPGLDGGGTVAADRAGNVYVVWHAPGNADGDHAGNAHGETGEEDRQVWVARSEDDGKTFAPEIAAIPKRTGVCACCGVEAIAAEGGRLLITFRSATAMVNRDIHVLTSADFGKTFEIATTDPWKIGQCVMSTAGFALRGDLVLAAWETEQQVRLVTFGDKQSKPHVRSMPGDAKNRKHPTVAVNAKGEYLVAWTEGTGWNRGGTVVWQAFDRAGEPLSGQSGRVNGLEPWNRPAVVATLDGSFKIIF